MRFNKKILILIILLVILASSLFIISQISLKPTFKKGVALSPIDYSETNFTNFLKQAPEFGDYLGYYVRWDELEKKDFGNAKVIPTLESQYKFKTFVALNIFDQSTGKLYKPINEETKQSYLNSLKDYISKYKVEYLALGIEVNTLYKKSPDEFNQFVDLYNSAYEIVKQTSPNTKIFTIFQLEHMKGLNGGLFGGTNDVTANEWDLINLFKSDLIGFTTYPGLIYQKVKDIPLDYYSEIKKYTDKPIALTEIGWFTNTGIKDWEGSEQEQADYIKFLFENSKAELYVWSFAYDQQNHPPFDSMGLITRDGKKKIGYNSWVEQK